MTHLPYIETEKEAETEKEKKRTSAQKERLRETSIGVIPRPILPDRPRNFLNMVQGRFQLTASIPYRMKRRLQSNMYNQVVLFLGT